MSLKAKRVKQSSRTSLKSPVLEADTYPARLVQVLDLGKQQNYFDKEKINHEIMLTYELVTEHCLDENDQPVTDKPRWLSENINMVDLPENMSVSQIYTDQFKSKSKLVQRCRAFDPKGSLDFDLSEMVNMPCALTVIQRKKKDGDLTNAIGGVTAPMKGLQIDDLANPPKVFSLEEPDLEIFGSLPDWLQDKIKGNLEFKRSKLDKLLNGETAEEPKSAPEPETTEESDDDQPW